jgi:glycosyltransferase involved in cell wall biosynthesis
MTTVPKMKIAYIMDNFSEFTAGCFNVRIYAPFKELIKRGHMVEYFIRGQYEYPELTDFDIVVYSRNYGGDVFRGLWKSKLDGVKVAYDLDDDVWCYSDDTEVLTVNGWKNIKDVLIGEGIYSYNKEKDIVEIAVNKETISKEYSGDMISFEGESVDLLTTPNHKMYASLSGGGNRYKDYELIDADKLVGKHFRLKKSARWGGKDISSFELKVNDKKINISAETFLRFVGYYISEGCSEENRITITQNNGTDKMKNMLSVCKEIADMIGVKCSVSGNNIRINSRDFASIIREMVPGNTYTKRIPKEIIELKPELLNYIYEALMEGDGSDDRNYYTSSEKLKDDFIVLVNKLGFSCRVIFDERMNGNYCISILRKKNSPRFNHHKEFGATVKRKSYNGNITCLSLDKNHIMLVRRNGLTVWSGNSIPPTNPAHPHYEKGKKKDIAGLCIESDLVTVSTEHLKKIVQEETKVNNIIVVPNGIDTTRFTERPHGEGLRIGWTGGGNHFEDLSLVLNVIKDLQKKYDFEFIVQGLTGTPWEADAFTTNLRIVKGVLEEPEEIFHNEKMKVFKGFSRLNSFRHVVFYPPPMYPDILRSMDLDIGLIPIVGHKFDKSKSFIKYLEYTATGTAVIASDQEPYKGVEMRVDNKYDKWYKGIEKLINDKKLREDLVERAKKELFPKYNIQSMADKLEKTYSELLNN